MLGSSKTLKRNKGERVILRSTHGSPAEDNSSRVRPGIQRVQIKNKSAYLHRCLSQTGRESRAAFHDLAASALAANDPWYPRARFEVAVKFRSHSKVEPFSKSSGARQLQFPVEEPGRFVRDSDPKFSKSCNGVIATAAAEHHAIRINSSAILVLSQSGRFNTARILSRSSTERLSNHPRVVLLSCVPVYTTALVE